MNRRIFLIVSLMLVAGLFCAGLPAGSAQAAGLSAPVAQTDASEVLTPEALANMTYQSELAPEGEVTLTDGQYEDVDNRIYIILVPQPIAYGTLDGTDAAAVLIAENGGGSGVFVNLAIVVDQDGVPVNVASTLLGDRVDVITLEITDDQIVVELVRQGPNDPMCCPTEIARLTYALDGDTLVQVDETVLDTVPQVFVDEAPQGYTLAVIPATPYDNSGPGDPTGAPAHIVIAFGAVDAATAMSDGIPYIAVFPAEAYAQQWMDAGDPTVANNLSALQSLLAARPDEPQPPMPILPPTAAENDLVAQVSYIDGNSYTGVRFAGRVAEEAGPVLNSELHYFFQGLTTDGQYLIAAQAPISTTLVPDEMTEMPADVAQAATDDFTGYLADLTAALNGLSGEDWSPTLSSLDTVMGSLIIDTGAPALTPEVLANLSYQSMLAPEGRVTLTDGSYEDTPNRISVTLVPEPMAFGMIDGFEAAAVLIAENGGGSGVFVSLAVVQDIGGTPANVATTLLGDRVDVSNLAITDDGSIIFDMVAQGPSDAMCCPTMPVTALYQLIDGQLVQAAQVSATIDGTGVTDQVFAAIIQPTAYDNTMPPGPQGQPKHPVWTYGDADPTTVMNEGGPYVAIYSPDAYLKIWDDAGDPMVADALTQLEAILAEQPAEPEGEIPFLPPMPATNDFSSQVQYLDLSDGGVGVRWVGRFVQDAGPVTADQLKLLFQGVTADGAHLIVAMIPVTTTAVPATIADVPADVMDQVNEDFEAYQAEIVDTLNGLTAADFTVDLDALDAMLQSVAILQSANVLLPKTLANMEYQSIVTADGVALLSNGVYEEEAAPGSASMNSVRSVPSPIAYGTLNDQSAVAVTLAESGGGSGTFISLAVVVDEGGAPVNVATTMLGDRVQVTNLTIADNQITVEMVTQGPDDPMCCPSLPATQTYELQGSELVMVGETTGATDSGSSTETAPELVGTTWQWVETQTADGSTVTPAQPDTFFVTFNDDGSVNIGTDCNNMMAEFTADDGGALTIEPGLSTMMACPDDSQQAEYTQQLASATGYASQAGQLTITLADGGVMTFAPQPSAGDSGLAGTSWQWVGTAMSDDSEIVPAQADAFVVTFGADGSAAASTDCNSFSGSFTEGENGQVTIELPVATLMACPEESQEQDFIADLTSVQSSLFEAGNLYLLLPFDSGVMAFAPAS